MFYVKVPSQEVHIPVRFGYSLGGYDILVYVNYQMWEKGDLSCETMERRSAFTPVTPRHQFQDTLLISAKLQGTPLIPGRNNLGIFTGSATSSVASDAGLYWTSQVKLWHKYT